MGYHAMVKLGDFHQYIRGEGMVKLSKEISWHCQNLDYFLFSAIAGISVIRSLLEKLDGIKPLDL